jgi:hypothetical protein
MYVYTLNTLIMFVIYDLVQKSLMKNHKAFFSSFLESSFLALCF